MDMHRKSEIELKYFLERRLVAVAGGGKNQPSSASTRDLVHHPAYDDLPRPKNKYQQKQSLAQNNNKSNQSKLKKSSSCNELVLQFEHQMRQHQPPYPMGQFQPSALFQGRKSNASEVFVDPAAGRQPRRPVMANRDVFEKQLDINLRRPPDPVQRIVNQHNPRKNEKVDGSKMDVEKSPSNHKVVIYFGDSIGNNRKNSCSVGDLVYASRAPEEAAPRQRKSNEPNDVMRQLKSVLEEKKTHKETKVTIKPAPPPPPQPPPQPTTHPSPLVDKSEVTSKPVPKEKPPRKDKLLAKQQQQQQAESAKVNPSSVNTNNVKSKDFSNNGPEKRSLDLPDFVESVTSEGVINIKIDGSYSVAKELVESVAMGSRSGRANEGSQSQEPQSFDWSFVQEWRSR